MCTAILRDEEILMVRHKCDGREYWTLPGGGVEPGESHAEALRREVLEETRLQVWALRHLFDEPYSKGTTYCYLAEMDGAGPASCRKGRH